MPCGEYKLEELSHKTIIGSNYVELFQHVDFASLSWQYFATSATIDLASMGTRYAFKFSQTESFLPAWCILFSGINRGEQQRVCGDYKALPDKGEQHQAVNSGVDTGAGPLLGVQDEYIPEEMEDGGALPPGHQQEKVHGPYHNLL